MGGGLGSDALATIERLNGSGFADTFTGGGGADTLAGFAGIDTLSGAAAVDTLIGGAVARNVLRGAIAGDSITDFTAGERLLFVQAAFGGLPVVVLNAARFASIAGAYDGTNLGLAAGSPVFIFSAADRTLYYDDNTGTAGYTVVATVQVAASITAGGIEIVAS
ncbi:MAG: hypothetical protein EXQ94_10015 [Alphaproteobacteria bacterium]|nr:hypothetical protein [Alphaproteobacteria bacterium]